MTHKKRDCLERPRKKGAKWTGDDIAPDEFIQPDLDLGFEGKRDRWNGYDPARHRFEVFEEFQKVDIARKAINAQRSVVNFSPSFHIFPNFSFSRISQFSWISHFLKVPDFPKFPN